MARDRRHPVVERCLPARFRGRRAIVAGALLVLAAIAVSGAALASRPCNGSSCDAAVWRPSSEGARASSSTVRIRWSTTPPVATPSTQSTPGSTDSSPPSVPTNQRISSVTTATATMEWSASTDNIGVTGYEAWLDDKLVGTTSATSYVYGGLVCGKTYTVGLVAVDAAGNRSDRGYASGPATTSACAVTAAPASTPKPTSTAPPITIDTQPPAAPTALAVSGQTTTAMSLGWKASSDNVGVKGYDVYVAGIKRSTTSSTSAGITALSCGSGYTLGVAAFDAAGNASGISTTPATTAPCAPAPAPSTGGTPVAGRVLEMSGSVSPSTFWTAVSGAGSGALTVRPVAGASSYTVTGGLDVTRAGLRIVGASVQGTVQFLPGANGSSFENGVASSFNIFGADDVAVSGSTFDGGGRIAQNFIWDQPAGSTPDRFKIVGNTIRNFYGVTSDIHSEGLYVGYSTDGLIEGNTFTNNGNTSHIFFTWFGSKADPASSYPRNICVRGNTFGASHGAYFAVNIRAEIPASTGIDVEAPPSNSVVSGLGFSASNAIVRAC